MCGSYGRGDAEVSHRAISVGSMKSYASANPMVPDRDAADRERHWYEQDLSVDELAATVAVINAAVRASRR